MRIKETKITLNERPVTLLYDTEWHMWSGWYTDVPYTDTETRRCLTETEKQEAVHIAIMQMWQ